MAHKEDILKIIGYLGDDFDYLVESKNYIDIALKLIHNPDEKTLQHVGLLLSHYQMSEKCYLECMESYLDQLWDFFDEESKV
ncbi:hypothetical protein NIES4101_28260 (plasmid) [Calothrix sp. NIES-4101]|nr:hypothetical protein NIES4101_28260 [Calothrix sp. NIES-4101]